MPVGFDEVRDGTTHQRHGKAMFVPLRIDLNSTCVVPILALVGVDFSGHSFHQAVKVFYDPQLIQTIDVDKPAYLPILAHHHNLNFRSAEVLYLFLIIHLPNVSPQICTLP